MCNNNNNNNNNDNNNNMQLIYTIILIRERALCMVLTKYQAVPAILKYKKKINCSFSKESIIKFDTKIHLKIDR